MKSSDYTNSKVKYSKMVGKSNNSGSVSGRFAGSVRVNTARIDEGKNMQEPNWYHMNLPDLYRARTLCKDRVKAGDKYWKSVRNRIDDAIRVKVYAQEKVKKGKKGVRV